MSMNRILESNYLFLERKNEFSRRGPFGTGSCRMSRSPISWPPGWASQEEGQHVQERGMLEMTRVQCGCGTRAWGEEAGYQLRKRIRGSWVRDLQKFALANLW